MFYRPGWLGRVIAGAEQAVAHGVVVGGFVVDRHVEVEVARVWAADGGGDVVAVGDEGGEVLDEGDAGVQQGCSALRTSSVVRLPTMASRWTPSRAISLARIWARSLSIWARVASRFPRPGWPSGRLGAWCRRPFCGIAARFGGPWRTREYSAAALVERDGGVEQHLAADGALAVDGLVVGALGLRLHADLGEELAEGEVDGVLRGGFVEQGGDDVGVVGEGELVDFGLGFDGQLERLGSINWPGSSPISRK